MSNKHTHTGKPLVAHLVKTKRLNIRSILYIVPRQSHLLIINEILASETLKLKLKLMKL